LGTEKNYLELTFLNSNGILTKEPEVTETSWNLIKIIAMKTSLNLIKETELKLYGAYLKKTELKLHGV